MHYYIDGYNLLFRFLGAGDDLRTQRNQITKDISEKINLLKVEATLVYDSHFQPDECSRSNVGGMAVVFTAKGETADEYILQELKEVSTPSLNTVVTSDKKLSWLCRRKLAKTESVEEFITWLNKRYRNRLAELKENTKSAPPLPPPSSGKVLRPLIQDPSLPSPSSDSIEKIPKKESSVEGCFDFYLDAFEKEAQELIVKAQSDKKQNVKKGSGKVKKKSVFIKKELPVDPQEAFLSDMQRWQNLFEKNDDDDQTEL